MDEFELHIFSVMSKPKTGQTGKGAETDLCGEDLSGTGRKFSLNFVRACAHI